MKVDIMANHTPKLRCYSTSGIGIDIAAKGPTEENDDSELTFLRNRVTQLEERLKQYEIDGIAKLDSSTDNRV